METYSIINKYDDIKYGPIDLYNISQQEQLQNQYFAIKVKDAIILMQRNTQVNNHSIYLITILDTNEIWFSYFYNNKFYSMDNYELENKDKVKILGECIEIEKLM